jgi:hypothetical protein
MQDRAVFGQIDLVAREHPLAPRLRLPRMRAVEKPRHRFLGDQFLRIVDREVVEPRREFPRAFGIALKFPAQVDHCQGFAMGLEGPPLRRLRELAHANRSFNERSLRTISCIARLSEAVAAAISRNDAGEPIADSAADLSGKSAAAEPGPQRLANRFARHLPSAGRKTSRQGS